MANLLELGMGGYNIYKSLQKKPISPVKTPFQNRTTAPQPPTLDIVPSDYDMQPPRPTSTTSTYQAPQNPVYQTQTQPMNNPFQGLGTIGSYGNNLNTAGLREIRDTRMAGQDQLYNTQMQDIFKQYKDIMGETKFQDLQARGEFTNAQPVIDSIEKVQKNITEGVINPQDIAKNTGMTVDQVNRIMGGRAFQDLQLSSTPGVQRERFTQDYMNRLQDLTKTQTRSEEDIQIKQQRLSDQLKTDTEDIQRKLDLTMGANEKMGALTGASRSSLYQAGLTNIQQDAERTIGELTKQRTNQTGDITRLKDRILEDYSENATRLKQTFDRGIDDMRMQGLSLIQDYQNKYGLNTANFTKAMNDTYMAILKEKDQIAKNYQDGMREVSKTQFDYYKMLQEFNDENNKYTVEGGKVISRDAQGNISVRDLLDIEQQQKQKGRQRRTYTDKIPGANNEERSTLSDGEKNAVIDQMTQKEGWGKGMRTERHNNPTAFTTDIAKQAGLVEGVDYTKGDAFPNNPNLFTARIIGDKYEITRRVIDKIGFLRGGQGGQQAPKETSEIKRMTNFALQGLTKVNKATLLESLNEFLQGGDIEQAKSLLTQQIVKKLSTPQQNDYADRESIQSQLDGTIANLEYFKGQGYEYNPNIFANLWRQGKNIFNLTDEEDRAQFAMGQALKEVQAIRRNQLFGASLTPGEKSSAAGFLVEDSDTLDVALEKIRSQRILSELVNRDIIDRKTGGLGINFLEEIKKMRTTQTLPQGEDEGRAP